MSDVILISGPIRSISRNLDQVTNFATCMYEEMKLLTCRFKTTYFNMFQQVIDILKEIHEHQQEMLKQISEDLKKATGDLKRRLEERKRKLEEKINNVKVRSSLIRAWDRLID